jgi:hypothetical protein
LPMDGEIRQGTGLPHSHRPPPGSRGTATNSA